MHEHHMVVSRSARYAVLGEEVPAPTEVWFVLHGYGQLAAPFLRRFQLLDDGRRRIYAPEALNHFYLQDTGGVHGPESKVGATWMTREDRLSEIADYVRYLDTLFRHVFADLDRDAIRVVTLGFSQGAATAARWAAAGRTRPEDLVLWGSPAPPDLEWPGAARALVRSRVTLVYGREDASFDEPRAVSEAERLRAHGVPPALIGFEGGHQIDAETLEQIAGSS